MSSEETTSTNVSTDVPTSNIEMENPMNVPTDVPTDIQPNVGTNVETTEKFSFEKFWNTGNNKYWIIGCIVVVILVIIIIIIAASKKNKEEYCPCSGNSDKKAETDRIAQAKQKISERMKPIDINFNRLAQSRDRIAPEMRTENNKETFVSTGGDAYVNRQGNITGTHVSSDMYSKVPYSELRNAVENNKPLPINEVVGAGRGDNFDLQYQTWIANQEKEMRDPTTVKTMAEIEETSKSVSANLGNDSSCMLTRAGSSRAKIKYEPNGTVAVCSEYSTPERDKNHIIYTGSTLVDVPGYQMDTNRINDEIVLGTSSLAKNFSPKDKKVISTAGGSVLDQTARGVTNTEIPTETFSANY